MDNKIIQHNSLLPIGTILRGIYRIDNYLSRGGFSNTYVATNIEFDEQVAVKEFFVNGMSHRDLDTSGINVSNLENSDQFNKMRYIFKRDAKRMRRMVCDTKNPHIVRVYDIFEENNTAYYVMEYINGNSLAEMLKRQNAPIDSNWLFEIFLPQMLDAIDVMHKINLWHLDIIPNNIMVEANGNVKLLGFGTHKLIDSNSGDPAAMSSLISPNRLYSPIELKDFDYKKIGPWTVFYSLGAALYNLATQHRPPFSSEILVGDCAFKFLPSTSEKFRKLVMWMMNVNISKRPQTVQDIRDFLKNSD